MEVLLQDLGFAEQASVNRARGSSAKGPHATPPTPATPVRRRPREFCDVQPHHLLQDVRGRGPVPVKWLFKLRNAARALAPSARSRSRIAPISCRRSRWMRSNCVSARSPMRRTYRKSAVTHEGGFAAGCTIRARAARRPRGRGPRHGQRGCRVARIYRLLWSVEGSAVRFLMAVSKEDPVYSPFGA